MSPPCCQRALQAPRTLLSHRLRAHWGSARAQHSTAWLGSARHSRSCCGRLHATGFLLKHHNTRMLSGCTKCVCMHQLQDCCTQHYRLDLRVDVALQLEQQTRASKPYSKALAHNAHVAAAAATQSAAHAVNTGLPCCCSRYRPVGAPQQTQSHLMTHMPAQAPAPVAQRQGC